MGRYFSVSQSLAYLLQTEKKMYDLASTLSGLNGYKSEEILSQLGDLERVFMRYDPQREELHKRWKQMLEQRFIHAEDRQTFESLVQELGGENIMKNNFARRQEIELRNYYDVVKLRVTEWKAYKEELEGYTQHHLQSYRLRKGDTNTKDDFTVEGSRIIMSSKHGLFFGDLISQIIMGSKWISLDRIRLNRLDVASDVTRMVRDAILEYGQDWEGSPERMFLNGLRQHIASGGTFDIKTAPSVILKGIAIFILKGDDFEEMMRYMEYSAQNDYRFVLGLWGACIGYADMPKTAIMRMNLDKKGEDKIYLSTCQLLVDVPMDVNLERHQYQFSSYKAEHQVIPHWLLEALKDKSLGISKTQRESILNIWKELNGETDKEFFDRVSSIKGIGKKKLQKLRQLVDEETKRTVSQPDLFTGDPSSKKKYFDLSAWKYIEPLLPPDQRLRGIVKEDFEWFMNQKRRYEDIHCKIADYGTHLYVKANPKKKSYAWTAEYYNEIDIEKLTAELLRIYDTKC